MPPSFSAPRMPNCTARNCNSNGGALPDIGYWDDPGEWISWEGVVPKSGKYQVSVCLACRDGGRIGGWVGGAAVSARVLKTDGWENFSTNDIGFVEIKQAGEMTVSVRAKNAESWNPVNLNSVQLTPADSTNRKNLLRMRNACCG